MSIYDHSYYYSSNSSGYTCTNAGWDCNIRSYDLFYVLNFIIAQSERWEAFVNSAFERYKTPKAILPTRIFMGVKKFFRRSFQPRWSRLRWRSTT